MTTRLTPSSDLLRHLKTTGFEERVYLAASPHHAAQVVSREPVVKRSIAELEESPETVRPLMIRLNELASADVDRRHASPHDPELLGLLVVLQAVHPEMAKIAASFVLDAPQTYLARRFALDMLGLSQPLPSHEPAAHEHIRPIELHASVPAGDRASDRDSREVTDLRPWARVVRPAVGLDFFIPQDSKLESSSLDGVSLAKFEILGALKEANTMAHTLTDVAPHPTKFTWKNAEPRALA